ncbi:MAG: hypothetical protein ACTSXC_04840 [Candidatus Freyarchaeota archaeon]
MTTTETFVAKVKRIRNRRDKEYYIYRITIPHEVAQKLSLEDEDYLLIRTQKAEWYHLLDWKQMKKTWSRIPQWLKNEILSSGLYEGYELPQKERLTLTVTPFTTISPAQGKVKPIRSE